jgi:hypothetical protein
MELRGELRALGGGELLTRARELLARARELPEIFRSFVPARGSFPIFLGAS